MEKTKKLSKEELGNLGLYDFQAYIGAMNQSTFGGELGTIRLFEYLRLKELSKLQEIKILEIGCSTGYNSFKLMKEFPNVQITGIDISEIAIIKANEEKNKLNLSNINFQVADATNLPFEDNYFDVVFGEAIVALLPEKTNTLIEFLRVTKSGVGLEHWIYLLKKTPPMPWLKKLMR